MRRLVLSVSQDKEPDHSLLMLVFELGDNGVDTPYYRAWTVSTCVAGVFVILDGMLEPCEEIRGSRIWGFDWRRGFGLLKFWADEF